MAEILTLLMDEVVHRWVLILLSKGSKAKRASAWYLYTPGLKRNQAFQG